MSCMHENGWRRPFDVRAGRGDLSNVLADAAAV